MNRALPRRTPGLLIALVLSLAACGDSSEDSTLAATPTTQPPILGPAVPGAAAPTPAGGATSCPDAPKPVAAPAGSTKDLTKKPAVPAGAKTVTALQVADVVVGSGALACTGTEVEMKYVGVLADGGAPFDASWDRGPDEVFKLTLGNGEVIPGWDQGIVGMKAGGRRQLTIPSELAYGPQGRPPQIPGGATLVFVVDLVKVG